MYKYPMVPQGPRFGQKNRIRASYEFTEAYNTLAARSLWCSSNYGHTALFSPFLFHCFGAGLAVTNTVSLRYRFKTNAVNIKILYSST